MPDTNRLRNSGLVLLLWAAFVVLLLNIMAPGFVDGMHEYNGWCTSYSSCRSQPTTLSIWAFFVENPLLTAALLMFSGVVALGGFYVSRRTQSVRVATYAKGVELLPLVMLTVIGLVALWAYPPFSVAHPLF